MNIIQIIHTFPPQSVGGSEFYLLALCQELMARRQVSVFYRIADPALPEYAVVKDTYQGLPVYKLNHTLREADSFERTYRDTLVDREFGKVLDEVQPDILHVHHLTCLSTTMLEEARARGIPVVYTLHDYWLMCHLGQLLTPELKRCNGPSVPGCLQCLTPRLAPYRPVNEHLQLWHSADELRLDPEMAFQVEERLRHFRALIAQVDLFIAPSWSLRKRFIQFGIPPEKVMLLRNGYQDGLFNGYRREPSARLRFGYIGNLMVSKGAHVLAEAFDGIRQEDAELKIYGDFVPYHFYESYPEHLRGLISNSGVRLMGGFRHEEIASVLEGIDVMVVPSIWYENSPLTIQEAFLGGVPVVASNIGGMAELVKDGVNGLLFQVGDPRDLRRVLIRLIEDRALLDRLRARIPPVTSMKRHAEELERIYHALRHARTAVR